MKTTKFDRHSEPLTRNTPLTKTYKHTQNVRRFMKAQCGEGFKFNRDFVAWIKNGIELSVTSNFSDQDSPKTLGDIADEWIRRSKL